MTRALKILCLGCLLALVGCASNNWPARLQAASDSITNIDWSYDPHSGIPNFAQVDYGIYRGGQPTREGWVQLALMGVTNVVKLNSDFEGRDDFAEGLFMTIQKFPISLQEQLFYEYDKEKIWSAVDAIGPNTYIHCQHGQDRTGMVVACWRVNNGARKADAEKEMLALGFHKSLFGLWHFWETHLP